MNKRKVTKRNGSKTNKQTNNDQTMPPNKQANNDPSQVFVLPPNLLEALGIDLGNIETAPECTSGNQISDNDLIYKEKSAGLHTLHNLSEIDFTTSSEKKLSVTKTAGHNLFSKENLTSQGILTRIPESNYTTSSENESSIIHTANLMKASVFLSPTFTSNNRSIIEGEVEILGSDKLMENAISIPNTICPKSEEYDQSDYMSGGVTFPHQNQEVFTVSNLENPKDDKSSEAVQETNKQFQSTDVHVEINKLEKVDNFDNHADEAYLSDLSNGNVEMNDKSNGLNSSVFPPTNINKKISIISEEIFDPTQLKAFQSSCINKKKCLIPVEMNTPLKSSFRNSDCYQNSINNDCDPNMVTYYVEPSVTIDSDLRDVNEQKLECEYITDLLLKNESYTETDFINHNDAACDSLNSHLIHNILSNVSEDVVVDTQMQEDSSQHKFQGHESEYTRSVLSDTLNCKEKCDLMETYISETRNTNIMATNYEEMELNETLQKVDPNVLGIENIYVNGNLLLSVSENVTNSTQMQEVSSQHELEVHKNMFDIQVVLADTFNCEDSDRTMETNVEILSEDIKSTNTFKTKFDEEKENNTLQKVNPNTLNEQKFCIDRNKVSSENKDVVITTKKQESSIQQAFEIHEKKLDPQLILMETPDSENSGNIIETTISDTKTSNSITTNYEEHKIKEASEKIDPSEVDKQNFHVDDKHQKITKAVSDKVNTKLTRTKENYKITSRDAKRKSGTIFVKDGKINSVSKFNLSRTNVNMQKLTNKVKSVKVIKKVLKRTRRKNTNLKIKDVLVKAEAKPTQKSPEELCNSCIVPDNNTKKTADHSVQLGHLGINNEVQEDKVREIAGYLRKFAELQKLKPTNTKLSIQGVEKPGGSEKGKVRKGDKNIKRYERKRIKKPPVKVSWITPNFDSLTQNNNLSINSSCNTCKDIDFCLCDDFGRLIYYDDESMYEHIHFWNREQVDCTPDLLFSIYNDIVPAEINNDDNTKILQDYPYEFFCAPDLKVNWKETNFIDSHGFNNDGNEHTVINSRESIESISLNIDKPNETNIDIQMKPDASKGSRSPAKNTENWDKKPMENVSLLENCQETINNNIEPDVNTMKNEKKRKYSSAFNGSDKLHTENTEHTESHLESRVKSEEIVKKQKKTKKDPKEKIVPGDQPDSEGSFTTTSLNKDTFAVCGVCKQNIKDTDWLQHIASQHNYLSWRVDEEPLDLKNRQLLIQHLATLIKQYGVLSCNKCGTTRKYAKPFLHHINQCATVEEYHPESVLSPSEFDSKSNLVSQSSSSIRHANVKKQPEPLRLVECGVCGESIHNKDWNSHIGSQHNYLAWKSGEQPLDLDDDDEVKEHLYNIVKESGGLKCGKCGLIRKYVKSYQTHIKSCDGQSVSESLNESSEGFLHIVSEVSNITVENGPELVTDDLVKCGVCGEFMHSKAWNSHIGSQHNYLAWKHGESTLDVDDEVAVKEHLYNIVKEYGGLKCAKCDLTRKYVKSYLTHISSCNGLSDAITGCATNSSLDVSEIEPAQHASDLISSINIENDVDTPPDVIQCAICGDSMHHNNWYDHIGTQHSYLAWRCGDPTLDFDDEEATYKHLYAITKEYGGLKCVKCGLNRKYVKSYLTHVKSCTGLSTKDDNPIADDGTPNIVVLSEAEQHPGLIKCGACGQYMPLTDWTAHIEVKHNYLAWKDDELPLHMNDKAKLLEHLENIVKEIGTLVCVKCGTQWKFAKSYLRHIEKCYAANSSKVTDQLIIWPTAGADQVKCGVCDELVQVSLWIKHIAEQHDYLAKKVGETPLDVDDEEQVYKHLYIISKENGGLVCQKCGKERKYVKSYLEHIRKCGQDHSVTGDTTFEANTTLDTSECLVDFYSAGTCAVCEKEIEAGKWIQHIQKEHNYLAWRKGETPWDLDDFTEVNEYLYEISKKMSGLTCNKCGLVRKYVKSYLTHIKSCDVVDFNLISTIPDGVGPVSDKAYRCAMCQKEIEPSNWKNHAMKEHYNITWVIGETPIDIKNPYAVEKYLKEYKQSNSLKCNNCGATRASFAGFYAHIITCGKTDEQIEMFQSVCDICKNKYLCIYKNQHMMIHKVQSYNKELKMSKEKVESVSSGKRQAAKKARTVLETYSSDMSKHSHKCSTCGFGTDFEEELQSHKCDQNEKDFSEEESSAAEEEGSEDESADSEVDSDISREEEDQLQMLRRKRCKESVSGGSTLSKINFKVDNPDEYVEESDIDFCNAFYTDETLFSKWISCKREIVSQDDLSKYLPPMEESCKVRAGFDWTTLKRFEAKSGDGTSIFVGSSIVCIRWIPPRVEDITGDSKNFLAIACHNDVDCPRYNCDELPQYENLIQIWDFGTFEELPQIVYGIAHDFGIVWSMDWCPSGARDVLAEDLADGRPPRLGLLAVACSNGSVYIFSVPHPSAVVENNYLVQKLKPVAELRMKMMEKSERKLYQATSVSWSKEKGHETIVVGYGDGTLGYYYINNTSPVSWRVEDEVDIYFPYNEERPHNTCITATDIKPRKDGGFLVCSSSNTGSEMRIPGEHASVRSDLPAREAIFMPHWPATLLAGVPAIMSTAQNVLEWAPPARKLGGVRALAGCARCGRVAASAPPALRAMRPHPAYPDFKKPIIGMIEMIPLEKTRKVQGNDEVTIQIEPFTYPEVIVKYGIQFQSVSERDMVLQQQCALKPKVLVPNRFPLAEVESMAFCPTKRHHDKLAVATHSGIVFLTDLNL